MTTDDPINAHQSKPKILRVIFEDLVRRSQATGKPASRALSGGASLLVVTRDDEIRLLVSRAGQPLGTVELATFERTCVPDGAVRWPREGQNTVKGESGWIWRVGWKWTVEG